MKHNDPFRPSVDDHKAFGCSLADYVRGVVSHYRALLAGKVTDRELRELRAGRTFIANAASTTSKSEFASMLPSSRTEIANIVGDVLSKIDGALLRTNVTPKAKSDDFGRWPNQADILRLI